MLPHTDDMFCEFAESITDNQLPKPLSLLLSAYALHASNLGGKLICTHKPETVFFTYTELCEKHGVRAVSERQFRRRRAELADLGYLIVSKTKKLLSGKFVSQISVLFDLSAIANDFKRAWRKVMTKAKRRIKAKIGVQHKQEMAKKRVNAAMARSVAVDKPSENVQQFNRSSNSKEQYIPVPDQQKSKCKSGRGSNWVEGMEITSELKGNLYNGTAKPEEVKHARKVYKFHGWTWPFYQYDREGRVQITGKAANEGIAKREQNALESRKRERKEIAQGKATGFNLVDLGNAHLDKDRLAGKLRQHSRKCPIEFDQDELNLIAEEQTWFLDNGCRDGLVDLVCAGKI